MNEPSSQFFQEPGKGTGATLMPWLFYHKLYSHSYPELAQYIDNIEKSNVSTARKEYEKKTVFDIVRYSRIYGYKIFTFFMLLVTVIFLLILIFSGKALPGFLISFLIFAISAANYYLFASPSAELYIQNFQNAHASLHGTLNEMAELRSQETNDYPPPPRTTSYIRIR